MTVAAAQPASAPPPPDPAEDAAPTPEPPARRWYGWQTLSVDAAAIGAMALSDESESFSAVGLGLWAFGSPVVHGIHGHPGKALGSFGLRAGGMLVIGAWASSCMRIWGPDKQDGACPALAAAAVLSIPATLIVDHAVLANEDVPRERPMTVAPWADPKRGAAGVAAMGTF